MSYRLGQQNQVQEIETNSWLPCTYVNGIIDARDWHSPLVLAFAKWVALGNVPLPAAPVVPLAMESVERDRKRDLDKLERAALEGDQTAVNDLVIRLLKE